MRYSLAYGRGTLEFELPDRCAATVVRPDYRPSSENPYQMLRDALQVPTSGKPLVERARRASKIGIIVNDITRATPTPLLLRALVDELRPSEDEKIVLFNATGTHRANTEQELDSTIGPEALRRFRVVQNDARDEVSHEKVGTTNSGNEIELDRELLECDLTILTGFIEPHFFAGFSGGGKALMPGMASLPTILRNHRSQNIDHPNATWGVTDGNPNFEEIREAAELVEGCFLLNVALNRDKEITSVFSGDLREAHSAGCAYVKATTMVPVEEPFYIVITSNSGYPLDLNLYQSVKGMSAASGVAKPGGGIIAAAECWDGIPEHGEFGRLLDSASSPDALLSLIRTKGFHRQDMWQAQILAKLAERFELHFYTDKLSAEELERAFLNPCTDIADTVDRFSRTRGRLPSICILPEGPVTIPYVR